MMVSEHDYDMIFSAPGRTELGGNHTDHQGGAVLAAAVELETLAYVKARADGVIRVHSEGYPVCEVDTRDLCLRPDEKGSSAALIRGIAAGFSRRGTRPAGFEAYCTSDVLPGSGLSSSASFEVLMGTVMNELSCGGFSPMDIAGLGKEAENEYFGKPCGLMDQAACALGSAVFLDFHDPDRPYAERIHVDFESMGLVLFIIDSGASHALLTDEYAAIPAEMQSVAAFFGRKLLGEVSEEAFLAELPRLRQCCGDRAVLRAMHFFDEDKRARTEAAALRAGDAAAFLEQVRLSGLSSWRLLQNVCPAGSVRHQEMAFVLTLAEKLLGPEGAVRVHGGGFAGTVQAFVPAERAAFFKKRMEEALGEGRCRALKIRTAGSCRTR